MRLFSTIPLTLAAMLLAAPVETCAQPFAKEVEVTNFPDPQNVTGAVEVTKQITLARSADVLRLHYAIRAPDAYTVGLSHAGEAMTRTRRLVFLGASAALALMLSVSATADPSALGAGDMAADFECKEAVNAEGPLTLKDLRGRVVLLELFSTG